MRKEKKISNSYPQEEKVFTYCVQNDRFKGYLKKVGRERKPKKQKKCKAMENREKIHMFKYCLMEVLENHRK